MQSSTLSGFTFISSFMVINFFPVLFMEYYFINSFPELFIMFWRYCLREPDRDNSQYEMGIRYIEYPGDLVPLDTHPAGTYTKFPCSTHHILDSHGSRKPGFANLLYPGELYTYGRHDNSDCHWNINEITRISCEP